MGWSHALSVCQQILEHQALQVPQLTTENQLRDHQPVPPLDPLCHVEYVDNFVALSQLPGAAQLAAEDVAAQLKGSGLRAHPVETGTGGQTLGWVFASDAPIMAPKLERVWRLRLGIKEALRAFCCQISQAVALCAARVDLGKLPAVHVLSRLGSFFWESSFCD